MTKTKKIRRDLLDFFLVSDLRKNKNEKPSLKISSTAALVASTTEIDSSQVFIISILNLRILFFYFKSIQATSIQKH